MDIEYMDDNDISTVGPTHNIVTRSTKKLASQQSQATYYCKTVLIERDQINKYIIISKYDGKSHSIIVINNNRARAD